MTEEEASRVFATFALESWPAIPGEWYHGPKLWDY